MLSFIQDGEFVSVEVAKNGGAKADVIVWRKGTEETLAIDSVNLVDAKGRATLLERLSEDLRPDAERVFGQAAIELVRRAHEARTPEPEPPDDGPFPRLESWPSPVDGAALFEELCELLARHVVLPKHADVEIALWIAHTFVTEVADYTPYLLVTSPVRECGKTTLLELLQHLAHRAQKTGGITAAALYRRIDRLSPTMLLDELDTRLKGDAGELLRGVLNEGFHRSGKVTICVGDEHEDRDFSVFCPKVLAGIGRVWDTVMSRSIPIRLARASREELAQLTKIRGDRITEICLPYRRRLQRWAEDAREALRDMDAATPAELGARQCDVWRPLLAIADVVSVAAGGVTDGMDRSEPGAVVSVTTAARSVTWGDRARSAALALHGIAQEEGDHGLLALQDVRDTFEARRYPDALFTSTILEVLCAREDRPWPEYRHDRPITPRGLASLLGRFGVKPTTVRLGEEPAKGYRLADLTPVFRTYLPGADLSVTSVTTPLVTDVTDKSGVVCGPALERQYELDERAGMATS
jgi:hypothetical protein